MRNLSGLFFISLMAMIMGCSRSQDVMAQHNFAKGGDIGWLTEMESVGLKFYNSNGKQEDCLQILKEKGMNSVRIRAWVNPKQWNNTRDVVVKALRAKKLGLKVMIDFHYSDDWADPGKQYPPAAWSNYNIDALKNAVSVYTTHVMDTLRQNGIYPEWVQVGNETNDGMMWEVGRASKSMANFAALVTAGYNAVKAVSSKSLVIVHLSNGFDNGLFRWMFDGLQINHAPWDIIGMSLYPSYAPGGPGSWSTVNAQCLDNMNDMVVRYGTPVMVVEVGMPADDPATAKAFLSDIIKKTRSVTQGKGLGVFYWEPECFNSWKGYKLGCFDDFGKPTAAMDAFLE